MDVLEYIKKMQEMYGDDVITTADKLEKPPKTVVREIFEDFNARNPKADGGQLVAPSVDGSRPGYANNKIKITMEEADKLGIPYKVKQWKNKGKFAIRTPKEKKYKFFKTEKQAAKYLADYKKITKVGGDTTLGLETKKYPKGYLTKKQFIQFLANNNISGKNPANFVGNYGINTKVNPYNKNTLIYDTSQFTPEKIESIQRAQVKTGTATEYAKKLFPPKTKSELQKPRLQAIEAKGGIKKSDPYSAPRGSGAQLGHTGNIFGTELITGDRLAYTPTQVNELMSRKGNLDDKIRTVSAKIENIKKSNKSLKVKKDLLEQADNILIRLSSQSDGFKKVTLSSGKTFGGDRLNIDPFDIYPGKTEKEIQKIQKKYLNKKIITEEMAAKNPKLKVTSPEEIQKIQDAFFFEENRKANLKAAQKMSKKEISKTIKKLSTPIEKQLDELAAQIDPDGCGRKAGATGGRIGFKFGSTVCATKAKNYLNQVVDKGIQNEPTARVNLIKKILSGAGNFVKQSLNPKELFKLENLIGKPALYATAAIESGLLVDDVLRKKEPINVAAAENFLFGNLLNLDADAARAKNIINDPNLSPAGKKYAQSIIDQDNFRKNQLNFPSSLIASKMPGSSKYFKMQENLKNKIINTSETGRMDYESLLADKQDAFTAKEKRFAGIVIDAPDKPGLPSFTSGQLEKRNVPGEFIIDPSFPLPLQKETLVPSYVSPSYSPKRSEYETDEFINEYFKSIGQEPLRPGEGTLIRMDMPNQSGLFGANQKFAGGGLASLTNTIPPKSGPMSQGLRSLYNNGRKL